MKHVHPLPSDFSDRTLTINLILKGSDAVKIRSCEVIGRKFRNRMSFSDVSDISDILVDKLAAAVCKALMKVPDGAHVMALPDFLVEVPGLALSGVHIMIMEVKNGVRNAIFRFTEFIGSINHAFKSNLGIEEPYAQYSERLAINVLADICLPILNLARELEFAHLQAGLNAPPLMDERTREFEFQTELLKRFIFNAAYQDDRVLLDDPDPGYVRRLTVFD